RATLPSRPSGPRLLVHTRSPVPNASTASPTATTVPTRSRPMTNGKGSGVGKAPERTKRSTWLTALASIRTSTSVAAGSGTGRSATRMLQAAPRASMKASLMCSGRFIFSPPPHDNSGGDLRFRGLWLKRGSEMRNLRQSNREAHPNHHASAAQHKMIRAAPSDSDSDDALVTKEIHDVGFALPAGHPRDRRSAEETRAEAQ